MTALGFHLELVFDDGRDGRQHLDQLAGVGGCEVVERHLQPVAVLTIVVTGVVAVQGRADVVELDLRCIAGVAALDKQRESHCAPPFNVVRTELWPRPYLSGTAMNAS